MGPGSPATGCARVRAPFHESRLSSTDHSRGRADVCRPVRGNLPAAARGASGRAEVVVGGLGASLFNAAARGLDFKVVGPVHMERPPVSTPLVVSKNAYDSGEIRAVADLRGKKVSVNVIGSATEFWLQSALL